MIEGWRSIPKVLVKRTDPDPAEVDHSSPDEGDLSGNEGGKEVSAEPPALRSEFA